MFDLAATTADTFEPHVGERFRLSASPADLELELSRVLRLDHLELPPGFRKQFILFFRTAPGPILPQHLYRLENEHLGEMEIFLVPFAADANGIVYQAPFS